MLGRSSDVVSDRPIIEHGAYKVRMMSLTWNKLLLIWAQLKRFRTLFSDLTKGDLENFIRYISSRDTLWLEVYKGKELVGIVTLEGMHKIIDVNAHVLYLDRDLADKVEVSKKIISWLFENFPFQRISVEVPEMYYATSRLVMNLGFRKEGKKRQAVLMGGKWLDVYLFGLIRSEVK